MTPERNDEQRKSEWFLPIRIEHWNRNGAKHFFPTAVDDLQVASFGRLSGSCWNRFYVVFILGLETRTLSGEFVIETFILSVVGGIHLSCHSIGEIPKWGRNANLARRFRLVATYFYGATSTLKAHDYSSILHRPAVFMTASAAIGVRGNRERFLSFTWVEPCGSVLRPFSPQSLSDSFKLAQSQTPAGFCWGGTKE